MCVMYREEILVYIVKSVYNLHPDFSKNQFW